MYTITPPAKRLDFSPPTEPLTLTCEMFRHRAEYRTIEKVTR